MVGLLMLRAHRRTWARQQREPGLNQFDLQRLQTRFRRRMQTSGLISLLGVMLGVGDAVIWRQGALVAAVYWILVIAMGGWLLLLGTGDLLSVRVDSRLAKDELARIGEKRQELEAELAEMRRRGSNGEAKNNGQHES